MRKEGDKEEEKSKRGEMKERKGKRKKGKGGGRDEFDRINTTWLKTQNRDCGLEKCMYFGNIK